MSQESIEPDQAVAPAAENPDSALVERRSSWKSTKEALDYLSRADKERRLKSRKSDTLSSTVLGAAIVCAGVLPFLSRDASAILLVIDIVLVACVVYYGTNRLGVLTALPPEKAAIAGELLLAAAIFGFCLAANLFGLIALFGYVTSKIH